MWDEVIRDSLVRSDAVLIFLSKTSIHKEIYVQTESNLAIEEKRKRGDGDNFLIPIKLEGCQSPAHLDEFHWIDIWFKLVSRRISKAKICFRNKSKSTVNSLSTGDFIGPA